MASPGPERTGGSRRDRSPFERSGQYGDEQPAENVQGNPRERGRRGMSTLRVEQVNFEPGTSGNFSGYTTMADSSTRRYSNDTRHYEFTNSPIHRLTLINSPPQPRPSTGFRTREAMKDLVRTEIDWNILSEQLALVDQDQYRLRISPFDLKAPKYFWITRNIDFIPWGLADCDIPRALLLSAPHGHGMTEVCSHIIDLAKQKATRTNGSVLYFFSSSAPKSRCSTVLIHTLLRQVIYCSSDVKASSIAVAFLCSLVDGNFDPSKDFPVGIPVVEMVQKILSAPVKELIDALAEAIKEACIHELTIIVDGIQDSIAGSLFEVIRDATPALEVVLTSQHRFGTIPHGMTYIEYDKERMECLGFLQHDDTRYDKISNAHQGSLEWLWEHPRYLEWSASTTSSLLYIEGKPGSGKSTLAKYFAENLVKREPDASASSTTVAHYFYTFRGTELENTHRNMLRSLLHRILDEDESTFFHFQQEFRSFRHGGFKEWPYRSLGKVLSSFADHPSTKPLYLILDAMDESEPADRRDIIELLCKLCSKANPCKIKAFVASRPLAELNTIQRVYHHQTPMIRLQDENKKDISRFADDFLKTLGLTDKTLQDATKYIIDNAQGVFVWVELVKSQLLCYAETGYCPSDILELLQSLPRELEDMYESMFGKIGAGSPRDIRHGIQLFRFTLFVLRPLTVEELRNALAVPDDHNPSYANFQENLISDIRRRIKHCGGGFLEIKGSTVQFMHQTARHFLLGPKPEVSKLKFGSNDKEANIAITTTLVRYLMLCVTSPIMEDTFSKIDSESWSPGDYRDYAGYLNQWTLMDYGLRYVGEHRDRCSDERTTEHVTALIQQLTNNQASYFLGNFMNFHSVKNSGQAIPAHKYQAASENIKYNTLDAAAELNLGHAVKSLLTCTVNDGDGHPERKTPLITSAQKGLTAAVRLLLNSDLDKDARDNTGRTALHYAAENGDEAIVRLLVEQRANREIKDDNGMVAVELAIKKFP